ncbi:MAG: glycosyltransferase family 4 protein [Acidobacteria bacterium]|nr:glycosyltransferase family 4 protein [Acidobacteriota bacterium]
MRIAIDIRRIEDFGVGTYIRNLILTLAAKDQHNQYILLGDPRKAAGVTASWSDNFHIQEWQPEKESWWNYLRFHHLLQATGAELLHIPYLRAAPLIPCQYLVTVHDVADFLYSAHGTMKRSLHWKLVRRTLAAARRVLAVSQATKRDIENLFEIPPEQITVVENAIDERFLENTRREESRLALERYQVNDPFLLYVGSARPQKNIPRLIEAFAVVKGEMRDHPAYDRLKLLIIGDELSEHPDLRRTVIRTRMQDHVRFLGFVPVATLRVFYQAAEVFVFPSLHEGFGLPPLEAMAQGTPVVTSNVSSLPEVVGDAAILVHPENVFDIARGIQQVLLDQELRQELRQRGRRQLERFSWGRSVEQVLEIYAEGAPSRTAA